uniref:hypothetical protein n=1 Tax=Polaromonas sp. TaxID=1869339 RepID=UPI004035FF98
MNDHSTPARSCAASPVQRPFFRGLLKALGLALAGVTAILVALALRSIPLAGQLWNRPEMARANQQPVMTAADKSPAEVAFRCC